MAFNSYKELVQDIPSPSTAQQPLVGQGLLIIRLHDHTQTHTLGRTSSGRVISPTQRSLPDNTQQTSMPPAGFEFAIQAGEQRQTHALDRVVTEYYYYITVYYCYL